MNQITVISTPQEYNPIIAALDHVYRLEAFFQLVHSEFNKYLNDRLSDEDVIKIKTKGCKRISKAAMVTYRNELFRIMQVNNLALNHICSKDEIRGLKVLAKLVIMPDAHKTFSDTLKAFNFKQVNPMSLPCLAQAVKQYNAAYCETYEDFIQTSRRDFRLLYNLSEKRMSDEVVQILEMVEFAFDQSHNKTLWNESQKSFSLFKRQPNYLSMDCDQKFLDFTIKEVCGFPIFCHQDGKPMIFHFVEKNLSVIGDEVYFPYSKMGEWIQDLTPSAIPSIFDYYAKNDNKANLPKELFEIERIPYGYFEVIHYLSLSSNYKAVLRNKKAGDYELGFYYYSYAYQSEEVWEAIAYQLISVLNIKNASMGEVIDQELMKNANNAVLADIVGSFMFFVNSPLLAKVDAISAAAIRLHDQGAQPKIIKVFLKTQEGAYKFVPEKNAKAEAFFDTTETTKAYS